MEKQSKTPANQPNKSKVVAIDSPEIQAMKKELEELRAKVKAEPLSLEEKINYFQEKQRKISQLAKLDGFAEALVTIGQDAQEASEQDEFFSEKFAVRVSKRSNSYREDYDDVLKIQNPVLVVEVLGYALERINAKRNKLKTEIEA
ncbi:hypothetical protein [uncultured Algoriphagus sp.]|uniref:hypothetical protein n=1 Tax=uncultured Algoriphagus sp. TaxID=417365 RepID=UPI00258E7B21|nr:hypothetical protein [uncultured Algoriphagus sp.]